MILAPLPDAKRIEKTTIETKLGKLTCEGTTGTLTSKDSTVSIKTEKGKSDVKKGDTKVRAQTYFHDKSPFGLAAAHYDFEFADLGGGANTGEAELTLIDVGAGAKSAIPASQPSR